MPLRRGRPPHPEPITPAEARVLELVLDGLPNAEIAVRLGLSVNTVKYHVSNLLTKAGVADRADLHRARWDATGRGGRLAWLPTIPAWLKIAVGVVAVGAVGIGAATFLAGDPLPAVNLADDPPPRPSPLAGPASRYAVLAADSGGATGGSNPINVGRGVLTNVSEFYPQGWDISALLLDGAFRDVEVARASLGQWGFDSRYGTSLGWGDRFATVFLTLFESDAGAAEAYTHLASLRQSLPVESVAARVGSVALVYGGIGEKPGQVGFGVLFRRDNLVVLIELRGAPGAATAEAVVALAAIVDAKATGVRPSPTPTPAAPPTPVAPPPWKDRQGQTPPRETLSEHQGPDHCDWQAAVFLTFMGFSYVKDPYDVMKDALPVKFEPKARLPGDAQFTGYRSGDRELWTAPSDPAGIYIRAAGKNERWPRLESFCI